MAATYRRSPLLVTVSTALVLLWIVVAAFQFLWTLWGSFKVQADFFNLADWRNALRGTFTSELCLRGRAITAHGCRKSSGARP